MSPLPLRERILLAVSHQRHTPRSLGRLFREDGQTIHAALEELDEQALLAQDQGASPRRLELGPGVEVEYRPGQILVRRAAEAAAPVTSEAERCTALTARGSRCKMSAVAEGLCQHHAP